MWSPQEVSRPALDRLRGRCYWLGGSACAGKSTVASALAELHGWVLYRWDDPFEAHRSRARADPGRWPGFERVMDQEAEALFAPPAEARADELTAFYTDEFEMVLEDLAALPGETPLLVEGAGVDPEALHGLGVPEDRALWLVAPEAVRRQRYGASRHREMAETLQGCSDPEAAFTVWMARDEARRVRLLDGLMATGYAALDTGRLSLEAVIDRAARHFQRS